MQLRAESGGLLFFIPLTALDTLPAQPALIKAPGPAQGPGGATFPHGAPPGHQCPSSTLGRYVFPLAATGPGLAMSPQQQAGANLWFGPKGGEVQRGKSA